MIGGQALVKVLILILVEVGFGAVEDKVIKVVNAAGLNPYSSGGGVR